MIRFTLFALLCLTFVCLNGMKAADEIHKKPKTLGKKGLTVPPVDALIARKEKKLAKLEKKKCKELEEKLSSTIKEAKRLEGLYEEECVKTVHKPSPIFKKRAEKLKSEIKKAKMKANKLINFLVPGKVAKIKVSKKARTKCNKLEEELQLTIARIKDFEKQFQEECETKGIPTKHAAKRGKVLKKAIKDAKKQVKHLKLALKPIKINLKLDPKQTIEVVKCKHKIEKIKAKIAKLKMILKTGTPEQKAKARKAIKKLKAEMKKLMKQIIVLEDNVVLNKCREIAIKRGLIPKPVKLPKKNGKINVKAAIRTEKKLTKKAVALKKKVNKIKAKLATIKKAMANATLV